ncbi:MLO-like protein 6 [Raphanus sativus]|nr:MLO-like protein 6 [Raphanus sativus]
MGSKMKPTVFNESIATALKSWHHTAKKQIKHGRTSGSTTPFSSRPTTPTHGSSPIHLLRNVHKRSRSADGSFANTLSPKNSDFDSWGPEPQQEPSSSSSTNHHSRFGEEDSEKKMPSSSSLELPPGPEQIRTHQHEINISLRDFSFKG